jgi:hypothetical protein
LELVIGEPSLVQHACLNRVNAFPIGGYAFKEK